MRFRGFYILQNKLYAVFASSILDLPAGVFPILWLKIFVYLGAWQRVFKRIWIPTIIHHHRKAKSYQNIAFIGTR
jgi:hypothetical protein